MTNSIFQSGGNDLLWDTEGLKEYTVSTKLCDRLLES